MKETSQAFSWRRLSALFAKVNLPLDSPSPALVDACVCVCASYKATQTHTHTQTDGNTRSNRKKKKSVSHPCRACAHRAASVRGAGGRWGVEGGGG